MRGIGAWYGVAVAGLVLMAGCARPAEDAPQRASVQQTAASEPSAEQVETEMEAARQRIVARADSARDALVSVRGLSRDERARLRQDVNARQVATARALGVRVNGDAEIQRLVRQGRLVALKDSTEYWILRDLNYSVPYVTPDTKAMLVEIGRRFHARLDSLGLPRYRMEVTSVLRTPESQADLRSRNSNAARGVSAHEFGTTLDVAHIRFAGPAASALTVEVPSMPQHTPTMRYVEGLVLAETARKHAAALQAELGRVLGQMRAEGKLKVMMERRQAVYHMTVARRFPSAPSAE